jgi:uncharacterized protein YdcH (DUF465 family)
MAGQTRYVLDRFPDRQQRILDLFETSSNFNGLCQEYGSVSEAIGRLEGSAEPNAEVEAEGLRRRRADLEDELLAMMQQTARV